MSLQFLRERSKKVLDRLKVADLGSVADELEAWRQTDFARYLSLHEHRVLAEKYSQLPGYRLMHLGLGPDKQSLDCFSQLHRFSLHAAASPQASAISNYAELPLPADTVDVALLQHAVEFSVSPKAVLAEVSRVVALSTGGSPMRSNGCLLLRAMLPLLHSSRSSSRSLVLRLSSTARVEVRTRHKYNMYKLYIFKKLLLYTRAIVTMQSICRYCPQRQKRFAVSTVLNMSAILDSHLHTRMLQV